MLDIQTHIAKLIKKHSVLLFVKGNKNNPQCGFSTIVINILTSLSTEFHCVDVLKNHKIRDGIKKYSSWPTIPQLYIGQVFIGGCDIVKELYKNGDLQIKLNAQLYKTENSHIHT